MEENDSSHDDEDDGDMQEEEEEVAVIQSPDELIALLNAPHPDRLATTKKRTALRFQLSRITSPSDIAVLAGTLVTLGRRQLPTQFGKISRVEVSCGSARQIQLNDSHHLGDPDWNCPAARDLFLAIGGLPQVEGLVLHCLGQSIFSEQKEQQQQPLEGNAGTLLPFQQQSEASSQSSRNFGFPVGLLPLVVCNPNSHWKYLHMDTVNFTNHPQQVQARNDQQVEAQQNDDPIQGWVSEMAQALQQQASLREFRLVHCQLLQVPPTTSNDDNPNDSTSSSTSLNQVLLDPLIAAVSFVPTLECLTIVEDATSVDNTAIEYGSNAHHNGNRHTRQQQQRSPEARVLIGLCKPGRLATRAVEELFQWMATITRDGGDDNRSNHSRVHLDKVRLWLSHDYPIDSPPNVNENNRNNADNNSNNNLLLGLCGALEEHPTITDVRVQGANAKLHMVSSNVSQAYVDLLAQHRNYSLTALSLFSYEDAALKVYLKANQLGRRRFVRLADHTMTRDEWLVQWIIPLVDACHNDDDDQARLVSLNCLLLFLRLQPLFLYAE